MKKHVEGCTCTNHSTQCAAVVGRRAARIGCEACNSFVAFTRFGERIEVSESRSQALLIRTWSD